MGESGSQESTKDNAHYQGKIHSERRGTTADGQRGGDEKGKRKNEQ